jgi:hypothetical protein
MTTTTTSTFLSLTLSHSHTQAFPHMWWHAILNLEEYNVFVSTFSQQ